MQKVCCVCQIVYGDDGKPDGLKSHGYCEPCAVKANADLDIELAKREREKQKNEKAKS